MILFISKSFVILNDFFSMTIHIFMSNVNVYRISEPDGSLGQLRLTGLYLTGAASLLKFPVV